ncbi:hypothetical protein K505DRAFT_369120 [Melanomma pulvis-pyrius CBS 109.77]|uniref:O-methyltransferase dimerisation domain-containing protein n=1 Tax=Melanomma pulvis-pyrius CBS 109.77 TaxID=1314802 RepID=A0A6A6WN70_9PLEO|nr:hypothetical protein K505DRAFT_369120 [Melanomma pulvis-pyrius CBS 109.77]
MASNKTTLRIVEVAAQISTSVTQLQEKLSAQGAPTPSFAEDGPELLPDDILLDPLLLLFKIASISNLVGIDAVARYHIPDIIPANGQITFNEMAENTGLQKNTVRRILRHAMSMRIFKEPEPEVVAHTKISKFLTILYINGWVEFESRDTWPATTRIVDAIQKGPNSEQVNQTVDSRKAQEVALQALRPSQELQIF